MTFFNRTIILAALASAALAAGVLAAHGRIIGPSPAVKPEHLEQLKAVLEAQPDSVKARYKYRNPYETMRFMGMAPGMKVAEVLPGNSGWYSKILLPYLGADGHLTGLHYSQKMMEQWRGAERGAEQSKWPGQWRDRADGWRDGKSASVDAALFGALPEEMNGQFDRVLFIRAMHHLHRFDPQYLAQAAAESYRILKDDGMVGIVQHYAEEHMPDDWADGNHGYLKFSAIDKIMREAGFYRRAGTHLNANPKDKPNPASGDAVWRLPPALSTSRDDPELRERMRAIGESHRMTVLYVKDHTH